MKEEIIIKSEIKYNITVDKEFIKKAIIAYIYTLSKEKVHVPQDKIVFQYHNDGRTIMCGAKIEFTTYQKE